MSKQKRGAIGSSKYRRAVVARLLTRDPHCYYCQKPLDPSTATIDHYIPLVAGGENKVTNFVLACVECNRRKADKLPQDFHLNSA